MLLSAFTAVLSLTPSIRDALIARANSLYFALAELLCVGMVSMSLPVHLVVRQAKFHQFHQLTFTEEVSKYYGRTQKGDKINLTSGGYVTIDKELGRGGQGIVYLVDLNGEKKALKWYLNAPDDKFYKNLEHNIMNGAPSQAFLWPEYLTKKRRAAMGMS